MYRPSKIEQFHSSGYDPENDIIPPLNYYTLDEPDYFFYDPEVFGEYAQKQVARKKSDRPDMDTVFGPYNYLRYYLPWQEQMDVNLCIHYKQHQ